MIPLALMLAAKPMVALEAAVPGVPRLPDWTARVNGAEAFVQETRVNLDHQNWSWDTPGSPGGLVKFAFSGGPVRVVLRPTKALTSVEVLPKRAGVTASVKNGAVVIEMREPTDLVVEPDPDSGLPPMHVFAGRPDVPVKERADTIVFGPGLHTPGEIRLTKERPNLYLAPGAVVRGWVVADLVPNVRITGSGTLDGRLTVRDKDSHNLIRLVGCDGAVISGPTLLDNPTWNVVLAACDGVDVSRVRILAARATSDGFDLIQSSNVSIDRSFVRNFDDGVALKGIQAYQLGARPLRGVLVTNSTFHCDNHWGGPFGVGFETYADEIADVTVRDCDVTYASSLLRILAADQAVVKNFRFERIRARMPAPREPFRIVVGKEEFAKIYAEGGKVPAGRIENVVFSDVRITGGPWPDSRVTGLSPTQNVSGLVFDRVTLNGKPLTAENANLRPGPFVREVEFR